MKHFSKSSFSTKMHYTFVLNFMFISPLLLDSTYNNKIAPNEKVSSVDTAYYFNERGNLIFKQPHSGQSRNFVIRTRRKQEDLYDDFLRSDDFGVRRANPYRPADVKFISNQLALKVEKLILKGKIDDPLVLENLVEILNKETLRKMRISIKGDCKNMADSNNFREYGGLVKDDGTITTFVGQIKYPQEFGCSTVHVIGTGAAEYHSHPAGRLVLNEHSEDDILTVIGAKRQKDKRQYLAYIQAPSGFDQHIVGNRMGYVFGMASRMIYVYDRHGIEATLPLAFAE